MPKILVVDDEPVILKVFRKALEREGRTLLVAGSAAEAVAAAREQAPLDVVLLDKNLGDRSGLEVARELKQLQPDVAILLVTGYASLQSAIEAVQIGAYDYLTKPIEDFAALELKVSNALERVRLAREQAVADARYRQLFDSAPDAIVAFDAESLQVCEVNPAAVELYGYPRPELLELSVADLFAAAPTALPLRAAAPAARQVLPCRCIKKDGTVFPAEARPGELTIAGRLLQTFTIRDVTERETLERERRAVEEQLRHAQKMEAVGRLASGLGHDLGNMLAVILTYSGLAQEEATGEVRQDLEAISSAGERAAMLTRQLMTIARAGPARPRVLKTSASIGATASLLTRTLGERIEMVTRLADDAWPVRVDPNHLDQVLLNLCVNARDAMPRGGTLTVTTENLRVDAALGGPPAGDYVVLSVSDTGVGMPDSVRARIFEPFFTTKERGHGTGLGLAVVYGIVRQAGGTIDVATAPGAGTTFRILLPRALEEPSSAEDEAARAGVRETLEGATVVVAEDDDAVRAAVARVLTGAGVRVLTAKTADDALGHSRGARQVDLLLTDVVMPRMSGTELATAFAQERPGVKIVFMTGFPSDAHVAAAVASGATVLQKPFKHAALLEEVRQALTAA